MYNALNIRPIYQNLCNQLDTTYLDSIHPSFTRCKNTKISNQDKRIIGCMTLKRIDETIRDEYAYVAREEWQRQKDERDEFFRKENARLLKWIREKDEIEKMARTCHKEDLASQQQRIRSRMKQEMSLNKSASTRRLEKTLLERSVMLVQRMEDRVQKQQATNFNFEKKRLDEEIRNRECSALLEEKTGRADTARKYRLENYRRQLYEENQKQELLHSMQLEAIKRQEGDKLEYLKCHLHERDRRFQKFLVNKMQKIEKRKNRAHVAATLRDVVRKSTSPKNQSYRNYIRKNIKSK